MYIWLLLQVYKADLVLLAMGFLGPEKYIISELELEQDPRSNIRTPNGKYSTSVDKVFAAGGKSAMSSSCQVKLLSFFHSSSMPAPRSSH